MDKFEDKYSRIFGIWVNYNYQEAYFNVDCITDYYTAFDKIPNEENLIIAIKYIVGVLIRDLSQLHPLYFNKDQILRWNHQYIDDNYNNQLNNTSNSGHNNLNFISNNQINNILNSQSYLNNTLHPSQSPSINPSSQSSFHLNTQDINDIIDAIEVSADTENFNIIVRKGKNEVILGLYDIFKALSKTRSIDKDYKLQIKNDTFIIDEIKKVTNNPFRAIRNYIVQYFNGEKYKHSKRFYIKSNANSKPAFINIEKTYEGYLNPLVYDENDQFHPYSESYGNTLEGKITIEIAEALRTYIAQNSSFYNNRFFARTLVKVAKDINTSDIIEEFSFKHLGYSAGGQAIFRKIACHNYDNNKFNNKEIVDALTIDIKNTCTHPNSKKD